MRGHLEISKRTKGPRYEWYFGAWGTVRCTPEAFDVAKNLSRMTLVTLLRDDRGVERFDAPAFRLLRRFSVWQLIIMVAHLYQDDYHLLINHPPATLRDLQILEMARGTYQFHLPRYQSPPPKRIIFLSFDGVLNCLAAFRAAAAANPPRTEVLTMNLVKRAQSLALSADARIVITAHWDNENWLPLDYLQAALRHYGFINARPRVIDQTISVIGRTRAEEIQAWLDAHPWVTKFAIIDVHHDMEHLQSHLVRTNMTYGIQNHEVQHALKLLM